MFYFNNSSIMTQQFFNISQDGNTPDNIHVNINNGAAEVWLGDNPVCTTNCKDALEHIVKLLAVKFDANLTNKSEIIYDTLMSW